jgi:hypothetical protein
MRMRQPPTERDQLKRGLVSQLKGSHARFVVIVAAVLPAHASLTEALANGKVRDHTSHLARGWKAERDFGHGWGWDPSVGFYEGLFGVAKAKGTSAVLTRVMTGIPARTMDVGSAACKVGWLLASSVLIWML